MSNTDFKYLCFFFSEITFAASILRVKLKHITPDSAYSKYSNDIQLKTIINDAMISNTFFQILDNFNLSLTVLYIKYIEIDENITAQISIKTINTSNGKFKNPAIYEQIVETNLASFRKYCSGYSKYPKSIKLYVSDAI